ncbi:MAG: tetratricopeptide repeat protein, partial [Deltaproteobacteria bacterium]|nr:tetratricopeptide repeat protein [Deltaproteobacteria bacterium]
MSHDALKAGCRFTDVTGGGRRRAKMGKVAKRTRSMTVSTRGDGGVTLLTDLERRARALAISGDAQNAIPLYMEAISRGTSSPDVFNDLGALLAGRGQVPPAVIQFEIALALSPRHADARRNLAVALEAMSRSAYQERRWTDAAAGFTRLAALDPDIAAFHRNAGAALRELKLLEQALPYLRRARVLDPDDPQICFALGSTLFELGQAECEAELARAIELDPTYADAYVNLAIVYSRLGQLERSAATARRALALAPNHVEAHATLAATLREQGEISLSLEHYRRALELRPDSSSIFSGYLLAQHAHPMAHPTQLLADHLTWAARFAAPLDPGPGGSFMAGDRARDPDPNRRLRVGYVSGDLRSHSVASFIEPIIAAHDPQAVEVFCYSDGIPDAVTARIRAATHPDRWRETRRLSDDALSAQINEDRIDVLVDLAGHTGDNRLLVFARRPAPVQVTYCGYPGTTGLGAIGWRFTDALADPPGDADAHHSEQLWRLPHGFLCFRPDPAAPPPAALPAQSRGTVTFGSFNNLSKLSDETVILWAEILTQTPGSHLLLKSRALTDPQPRQRLCQMFGARGVDPDRIEMVSYAATPQEHLTLYDRIDIALDPFPYNGTTTTCEALWMGVPVVTLCGQTHAGRVGASLLRHVGCSHLVAPDKGGYLDAALRLANDLDVLTLLRRELRPRMAASALTNPVV